ncbi:MAG: N-succinylarginine dihydrolase [Litorimonas sp.]
MSVEMNFDGLVGPSHNYAGLSYGNIASSKHKGKAANPRAAALQGLAKMRRLIDLGIPQAILPPQERPFVPGLRALGFGGTDAQVLETVFAQSRALVANYCSASSMWTANAATVTPGADSRDGRVHFTPANLTAMPHRALEDRQTHRALSMIFADDAHFAVHAPLAHTPLLGDEGAANHNRLSARHGDAGVEIFIYGRDALGSKTDLKFPGRQTLQASESVARLHGLNSANTVFCAQSATAINAGAFHNDVVCVSNETVLFFHENAFDDPSALEKEVSRKAAVQGFTPHFVMAPADAVPLTDTISSYLFNSQLVTLQNGEMALILPTQVEETPSTKAFVDQTLAGNNPITQAHYLDLRQSMANGGGPACLRLRVVLDAAQRAAVHAGVVISHAKIDALENWVKTHYRDRLTIDDLGDAVFLTETRTALDALTQLLDLPALYDFQRSGA